ncbi:MAG: (Fe-S)-binding protein [Bacteroidales bacterium]
MGFDLFVLPFTAGLVFILGYFIIRCFLWMSQLSGKEQLHVLHAIPTIATFRSMKEVLMESLLHRKIFKTNPRLGYMHMSLAFGWFLLIVGGNIEAFVYRPGTLHPPYYPIFFRFFEPRAEFTLEPVFAFFMDLFLLLVLSGVALAFFKRFHSRTLGMKKTTQLLWNDRLALISLWLIFPARFLAESFTSGANSNGGFITGPMGYALAGFLPVEHLAKPAWWLYSLALGTFFFALPFSRYMHIPTEIVLIFLRNYGIRTSKKYSSFSEVEVYACSRCGICIDSCPMQAAQVNHIQSVYFVRAVRNYGLKREVVNDCLMCGRCNETCPVGVDNFALRRVKRAELNKKKILAGYEYIPGQHPQRAEVAYFAGCMGQLTPTVTRAMEQIMQAAGEKCVFLDKTESICCGRPLMLAGREEEARVLMEKNIELIRRSGVQLLVTSCPICYKVFKEEYSLGIMVMHHSQYIEELLSYGRISVEPGSQRVVYHDPCELGRGSGVYEQPRTVIRSIAQLEETEATREASICCGGSLGNTVLNAEKRAHITRFALENLTMEKPDQLITSCPLCKKTFAKESDIPVTDLAELVAKSLVKEKKKSGKLEKEYHL